MYVVVKVFTTVAPVAVRLQQIGQFFPHTKSTRRGGVVVAVCFYVFFFSFLRAIVSNNKAMTNASSEPRGVVKIVCSNNGGKFYVW